MTTRAAIADALVQGGRSPDTPVAVIARGTTAAQQVARTTLAGLADVDLGPPAVIVVGPVAALGPDDAATPQARPAGRAHGGGHPGGRRGPGDWWTRWSGRAPRALELALTRQVDPADGGAALRAAAAAVRDNSLGRVDLGQRGRPLHGRAARRARPSGRCRWPRWGRPRPTRCAGRASSRIWCRPSTARAGSSRRSPTPSEPAPVASCSPAPTWRPTPSPRASRRRAGRCAGWRRTARCRRAAPDAGAAGPGGGGRRAHLHRALVGAGVRLPAHRRRRAGAPPAHVVCIGPTTAAAARAAGLAGVHEARDASAAGHRRRAGRALGPRWGRRLVGWHPWPRPHPHPLPSRGASRRAGCAGCAAPRRCGAWSPRPVSASTTWSPRCSCGRAPRRRSPSRPCPARCSTPSTRSWSRPSGWSSLGVPGLILFGVPAHKDAEGSGAWDPDGVVQVALRAVRDAVGDELVLMADLCLDEYTDHGHCGVLGPDGRGAQRRDARALPADRRWPRPRRAPTSSRPAG